MYRRHLKEMENEQLVSRVTGLPLVTSALEQVTSLYAKTKDYNRLTRLTCQLAEAGAGIALTTSKPVVGLIEPQLHQVNDYGLRKLDAITEAYPIITKPTDEVLEETKAYVKPTYDRIVAPVNYTVDTYNSVKSYGLEKVSAVKTGVSSKIEGVQTGVKRRVDMVTDFGCNTVKEVLETSYGKALKTRVDETLDNAEKMVDTYLPEEPTEEEDTKPAPKDTTVSCDLANPVVRVSTLGSKVRRRMYNRAMKEVTQLHLRSKEALEKLNFSVDLMKYAHEHFDSAKSTVSKNYETTKEKMTEIWEEVKRDEDAAGEKTGETPKEMTVERRTILAARLLTRRLKQSMTTLSAMSDLVLPVTLKVRVQEVKQYSEEWFKAFSESHTIMDIPAMALDKVKSQISKVQDLLSDMTDYILASPALSWLGLKRTTKPQEIEMEPLEHDEDMDEVDEDDDADDEGMRSDVSQ